ncbi:ABC transporter ATP-binding protein [Halobacillus litoralis]|uniref:ABC transporter ATP-binding protein n=1 Tax=Halobacillus litoralis TaxID=45668 RepID=UPI001CD378A6|nr:ABC transporter ATP-binding protein [Halobacillus litoralis]MCA0972331.1 ABC transporter ATP-binding protein [Halobacillus litoralis]
MLSVEHLAKDFGRKRVLHDVTFSLEKGESVLLLGANGAGKTTLLDILMGNIKATNGHIDWYEGKKKIGLVLQDASVIDRVTVKELIQWTRSLYTSPLSYQEVIQNAGLVEMEKTKTDNLSIGQKRKLHFSLALVGQPDLLIMDEPTAGMDVHARKNVYRQIEKLKKAGMTILMTTHVLQEASLIGDRVLFLENGVIKTDETVSGLESTTTWIRFRLENENAASFLQQQGFTWNSDVKLWEKETRSSDEWIRWLVENNVPFQDLSTEKKSMENFYEEWTSEEAMG